MSVVKIDPLQERIAELEQESADLELLLDTITEHSTDVEGQLLDYVEQVGHVTAAAAAVEASTFDPSTLDAVAGRTDALGQLARVFQRMAREVRQREDRLKQEVQQLRIEIDSTKRNLQVAEITETDFFHDLQTKAQKLRENRR